MPSDDYTAECLKHIENKYLLTIIISKRTNQLNNGAKPLIASCTNMTPHEIALKEVALGKITYNLHR